MPLCQSFPYKVGLIIRTRIMKSRVTGSADNQGTDKGRVGHFQKLPVDTTRPVPFKAFF
jgi:hypothetical protein